MARAREVARRFAERHAGDGNVLGVGIGLNAAGDAPAIDVQVEREPAAGSLPAQFDGLEVVIDVVGTIRPL